MTRQPVPEPSRKTLLMTVVGGVFAVALLVHVAYQPLGRMILQRRGALNAWDAKIADAQHSAHQLHQHAAALEEARADLRALERRIGQGQSVAKVLEVLGQRAKDRRIEVVAVQGRSDADQTRTLTWSGQVTQREVPLSLQLTGRYRQLGEFLGSLADAPFLVSVRTMSITRPQPESPKLHADVVLSLYLVEHPASQ